MFAKASDSITKALASHGKIEEEDVALCRYGVKQLLTILLNWMTTLAIGLIFDMVWESILFTLMYIPLRSYAGGFHAKTPLRCYFYSIVMTVAVLVLLRYAPHSIGYDVTGYLISSIVLWCFAPVEDANKPLDEIEKKVYRRRTILVWFAESTIVCILFFLHFEQSGRCVVLAMLMLSGMVIAGKIKAMLHR